jgi:hypothetical protein
MKPTDVSPRKLSGLERIAAEIEEFRDKAKLDSWNSFIDELQVPGDIYPALVTMRPELMPPARELSAAECRTLYTMIGGLIATNVALRQHTERVAQLTENLSGQMVGFQRVARQIELFANFRNPEIDEE